MTSVERITAADVKVGDHIATTKADTFREVTDLSPGERSVYITLNRNGRIRPRYTTKLWRLWGDR